MYGWMGGWVDGWVGGGGGGGEVGGGHVRAMSCSSLEAHRLHLLLGFSS